MTFFMKKNFDRSELTNSGHVALVIPSYNPDGSLLKLINNVLQLNKNITIIIVNDGSRSDCTVHFSTFSNCRNVTMLHHNVNLGKGRALKTAFNFYLNSYPGGIGVVTADADGQHAPEDIIRCIRELEKNPDSLILGCRNFSGTDVPWKSKFGNNITKIVMSVLSGIRMSDTQTGLRGIPASFLRFLLNCPGERFEYETLMLLEAKKHKIPFKEIVIKTIYENGNRETHFNPVADSTKIYRVIISYTFAQITKFLCSGAFSAVVDLAVFGLMFHLLFAGIASGRLFWSVTVARICSLLVNYTINRELVFNAGKTSVRVSLICYLLLCIFIMLASYLLVKWLTSIYGVDNAIWLKALADTMLFFVSYFIQKKIIFKPRITKVAY